MRVLKVSKRPEPAIFQLKPGEPVNYTTATVPRRLQSVAGFNARGGFDFSATFEGNSRRFSVYYDQPALGATGKTVADAVLANCDSDYNTLSTIFGNITPPGNLNWTLAGNTAGFGHGINDGRPFWIGDFDGDGRDEVLFYSPGDDNWWLGKYDGTQLAWSLAGNTASFGHRINDGRPFWIGRFSQSQRSEVLFYYPGDDNWWLGTYDGNQLQWSLAGNTASFGHRINDGRLFWIGDFDGDGRDEVLFYYPGDDNWWLGTYGGNQLQWSLAGNTASFGHRINDGRPFWIGRFSQSQRSEVLFYYPGDDNWWLGTYDGNQLQWSSAGNTAGFGHRINDGRPFWIGDFDGDGRDEVLFYSPGDDNWWLGKYNGTQLAWSLAGNTASFGHGINDGRPFFIGDFGGTGRTDVLFYYPGDGNWWVADLTGSKLSWSFAGNTLGKIQDEPNFGQVSDGRPFWSGRFSDAGRDEILFYSPGDDSWWLGSARLDVIVTTGIHGAYHHGRGATDIYCDSGGSADVDLTRFLEVSELVEVFEAAQGVGWDGAASNGEGLSRVLAVQLYPDQTGVGTTAANWLDAPGRPDYVNVNDPFAGTGLGYNPVSIGCTVLFLNWLRYQLGYTWAQIVQAGASTLAQTYTNLNGGSDGFTPFKDILARRFPEGKPSGLMNDNPFPI
jgi:hypothetical protein